MDRRRLAMFSPARGGNVLAAAFTLVLASGSTLAASRPGYLSTVGPPALRFTPPPVVAPAASEPVLPLAMPLPASANSSTNRPGTNAGTTPETNLMAIVEPPSTNSLPAPDAPWPAAPSLFAPETQLDGSTSEPVNPLPTHSTQTILPQPQLFLQYFTPDYISGTNHYGVLVPVTFVPPQPRAQNSSATYQVTPAERSPPPEKK
jgi:hypothetical protein